MSKGTVTTDAMLTDAMNDNFTCTEISPVCQGSTHPCGTRAIHALTCDISCVHETIIIVEINYIIIYFALSLILPSVCVLSVIQIWSYKYCAGQRFMDGWWGVHEPRTTSSDAQSHHQVLARLRLSASCK